MYAKRFICNLKSGKKGTIYDAYNHNARKLTIEKRKGEFPGMLTQRTFHIIVVDKDHGVGTEPILKADKKRVL
jgi:alpha-D-xyloside xylohydrolase